MYGHPKHLVSEPEAWAAAHAFDRLALIVTHGADGLAAANTPLIWEGRDRILAHVARANPHWRAAPCPALVVMVGPETYISPSWYETKRRTGRVVPTWNYQIVHCHGQMRAFEDRDRLRDLVARLSARHEAAYPQQWRIEEAPEAYITQMLDGIVGLEIAVTRVAAKRKLSQDKSEEDFDGVVTALAASADPRDHAVAAAMTRAKR